MLSEIYYPLGKNKLDVIECSDAEQYQSSIIPTSSGSIERKRLVVLLSTQINNDVEFCKYIIDLAGTRNSDVFLLMLVSSDEDESAAHVKIASISSLLQGFNFKIESEIVHDKSWIKSIERYIRMDDVIVCPCDLNSYNLLNLNERLSNQLVRRLAIPVQTYSGFIEQSHSLLWNMIRKFGFWLGFILIAIGFFWIESSVSLFASGWVRTSIEILLVLIEIKAVYYWFSFTERNIINK